MPSRKELMELHKLLVKHFDGDELDRLCFFHFGISYDDDLKGSTKTDKVKDLIAQLQRSGKLSQLIDAAKEQRPNVAWPDVGEKAVPTGDSYIDEKTGLEMIRIPAGEFIYGEETEARIEYLDKYWIAKTPVTNRHYARFVRATNQEPPEHWNGSSTPAAIADHPVVEVTWHDATAYSKWAEMELPTEQEWEKAARGTDGREYPWGKNWQENHCNTRETGIGGTTPVGQFSPQGDSPYDCVDMAGNVWEWTASRLDKDSERRVLRGGSWYYNQHPACTAFRFSNPSVDRNYNLGFRVVAHRPPS